MGVTIRSEYRHFRVCGKLVVGLLLSIMITSLTIQNASADPAIRYVATTGSNAGAAYRPQLIIEYYAP